MFVLDPQVAVITQLDVVVSEVDSLDSIVARVERIGVHDEGSVLLEECQIVFRFRINVQVVIALPDVPVGTFGIHERDTSVTQRLTNCDTVGM